jgi:hypothetical protein
MSFAAGSKPVGFFAPENVLERHQEIVSLRDAGAPVAEICKRVGFSDRTSIYPHLRREMGVGGKGRACYCPERAGVSA